VQDPKHDRLTCRYRIEKQIGMAIERDPTVIGPGLDLLKRFRKASDPLFDLRYPRFKASRGGRILPCEIAASRSSKAGLE
jgi:hypothetical protein